MAEVTKAPWKTAWELEHPSLAEKHKLGQLAAESRSPARSDGELSQALAWRDEARALALEWMQREASVRASLLAVHDLAAARITGNNILGSSNVWCHDMTEIERIAREGLSEAARRPYPPAAEPASDGAEHRAWAEGYEARKLEYEREAGLAPGVGPEVNPYPSSGRVEPRWIATSDRLPSAHALVLFVSTRYGGKDVCCGKYDDDQPSPMWRDDLSGGMCDDFELLAPELVTHWMPLPIPPSPSEVKGG